MVKAVVDRIVDGKHAVLLVGDQEVEKVISSSKLPDSVTEGSWVKVEFNGDELVSIEADEKETNQTKKRIKTKMEILRQRSNRRT
ncbi:DUF3006 domain-containing protein [Alkalihalobacillus deserti]|uniref:DUF3006 domain-containing protein n=1 Tax=Alkalihalobacillus deserti TaxID=2879466 RepID=UPI001D1414E1|nr:DUF3006 domain-containing protein [Alkalihalobacillus deserti]